MQLRQHVRDSLEWVKTLEKSTLCCVTAEIDPIYQQITVNHLQNQLEYNDNADNLQNMALIRKKEEEPNFIVKFVIYNATLTAL